MSRAFVPGSGRPLGFDDQMMVEDILDAASEWAAGRLPTTEAVKIGGKEINGKVSPGYGRYIAICKTPKADPRWECLYKLVTHLDKLQGGVHTKQGRFSQFEFMSIQRDNERRAQDEQRIRSV